MCLHTFVHMTGTDLNVFQVCSILDFIGNEVDAIFRSMNLCNFFSLLSESNKNGQLCRIKDAMNLADVLTQNRCLTNGSYAYALSFPNFLGQSCERLSFHEFHVSID